MPQVIVFLEKKENEIVIKYSKEWKLSKAETIKRLIKDSGGKEDAFTE